MTTWSIQLEDENGVFWYSNRRKPDDTDNTWTDDIKDAKVFRSVDLVEETASHCKARVSRYIDWFPRVRVVAFKTEGR